MSFQKRTKASASISLYSGQDPCDELVLVPSSFILDVMVDVSWEDVNENSLNIY